MTADPLARLTGLSPAQRELLGRRLRTRVTGAELVAAPRDGDRPRFPLSAAQRRLWFAHQLEPGGYAVPLVCEVLGAVDPVALGGALDDVVGANEILRTAFVEDPAAADGVVQEVRAAVPGLLRTARAGTPAAADAQVAELVGQPFELAEPPVRALLVTVPPDRHRLAVVLHHIVFDGWSQDLLLDQLTERYAGRLAGRPAPAAPALQYGDFAVWERSRGAAHARELDWWRDRLTGGAGTELPGDRPRPPVRSLRGDTVTRVFDAGLAGAVRAHQARAAVSTYVLALTAFVAVLGRLTGEPEVTVGSLVSGRTRPELAGLLGPFLNTVVLRVDLAGDPTLRELTERVRDVVGGAVAHQEVPFGAVVDELAPVRDPGRNPLFQLLLQTGGDTGAGLGRLRLGAAVLRPVPVDSAHLDTDLTVGITGDGDTLGVVVRFATDLYDRPTVETLVDHLAGTIRSLATDPDTRVSGVRLTGLDRPLSGAAVGVPGPVTVLGPDGRPVPAGGVGVVWSDGRSSGVEARLRPDGTLAAVAGPVEPRPGADGPADPRVAALMADVLGLPAVAAGESFFTLGGDSILAVRLVGRLRAELGAAVTIADVFRAPTPGGLSAALAAPAAPGPALRPRDRSAAVPLSAGQRRLWFLDRSGLGSAYHISLAVRLSGELSTAALRAALADVVTRHEALRTVFPATDGEPTQHVLAGAEPELHWRPVPAAGAAAAVDAAAAEPFDLATQLPLRAYLFEHAPGEHTLLLVLHHIAGDERSTEVLARDLTTAYAARLTGAAPAWPPLPVQYADHSLWQQELLDGPLAGQAEFWRAALAGLPERIELPTGRTDGADPAPENGTVGFEVGPDTHRALLRLARAAGGTPFMVVQAAVAALLTRLGAGTDIPLGTVVSGRSDAALDDLVGFFVNTLVLRTDTAGDPTFRDLLERVRAADADAYAHQDLPFDRLVELLNPERSGAGQPLFQVLVTWGQESEELPLRLPGVVVRPHPVGRRAAKFDLAFDVAERAGGGLSGVLDHRTAALDAAAARRLAARLVRFLDAVATDPDAALGAVEVLLPGERDQVLTRWDGTRPSGTVPCRFTEQVRLTPRAPAVVADGVELSYAELDAAATALAGRLGAAGVRPEDTVALAQARSVDLVVSVLAVLRTGAAYVPLHLGQPAGLLHRLTTDAEVRVLLTDRTGDRHPFVVDWRAAGSPVVAAADRGAAVWPVPVHPDQLAYVMFTSGSTGVPKGVATTHANVVALAADHRFRSSHDRVLLHSSYAFDASTYELWVPLLTGGTVVVAPAGDLGPAALRRAVDRHKVTAVWLTAGLFALVADEDPGCLAGLRTVWTGGDVVPAAAVRRVLAACPGLAVVDGYGPTETTTFATAGPVGPAVADRVPIGRPLDGTGAAVLDPRLDPVPVGVPGELYLSGTGLARGYLGDPALTADRFRPDPDGPPGSRRYRTGDLVRRSGTGELDFLGRLDGQLKVRGFRVEPAEIAAALRAHPAVRHAVVVPRGDVLVGYVTPAGPDTGDLVDWVRGRLPDYLVPSAIVPLERIPLTANGKLDRAALPDPPVSRGSRLPRTAREEVLCAAFADVLGVAEVGIDDSFFALGGHSLLAVRLASRVRTSLRVELPIGTLFDSPTVAGLAVALGGAAPARSGPAPGPRPARLPTSPAQRRLWFLDQLEPGASPYLIPLASRLSGPVHPAALRSALADVCTRHEILRTVYAADGGTPYQVVLDAPEPVLTVADTDEAALPGLLSAAVARGIDLASELPLRAYLWRLGSEDHVLLLVVHHIAADGASLRRLTRDLATAYAARVDGRGPEWPPLPVQYADHALWQLTGPDHREAGLQFWRETLAGLPDEVVPAGARPRPPAGRHPAGTVELRIGADVHRRLLALARARQVTPFMVVHAAVAALLTRCGAGEDIAVGTPVAGRDHEVLTDLVGLFAGTVVLRTDTTGDPTFDALLDRVRAADLAAFEHSDVPFEQVVDAMSPARSLGRHPLFQVSVALLDGAVDAPVALPGTVARSHPLRGSTAKFDLTVELRQQSGADGLTGAVEYDTDRFDRTVVQDLADRLVRLLTAAVDRPEDRIGDLDLLAPAERHNVLVGWNDTDHPVPGSTLDALLSDQAARTPAHLAVVAGGTAVSYAALDARVARLARRLVAAGAGPEQVVAVAVPRSVDLVVALLAVLRAGAAYLPLDPGLPAERVAFLLADAGAVTVVTDGTARLPGGVRALSVADAPADGRTPLPVVTGSAPAYVIYTSGSTGRPKGVVVSHAAIVNRLLWMQAEYGLGPGDRVLQKTPAGFDVSVWEFFWPLLTGATLVVAEPDAHRDPARLARVIEAEQVTVAHFVPSMLAEFLPHAGRTALRLVVCSGEALPAELAARFRAVLDVPLHNLYGPTEAAVDVTQWACSPADTEDVPIGRPIWNTRMYVLDARLRPQPVDVPGDLHIAGAGLARGYLGRPALTAEAFRPDPFGPPGSRLYRTGDLASWRPDGALRFHGRADQQIKLRGLRIEPGEIEAALLEHPGVHRAVVLARAGRLMAYVVGTADPEALRSHLTSVLPEHLVPAGIVILDRLPVTPNGKLDRAALPDSGHHTSASRAPRSPREEALRALFAQVLGAGPVGVSDNFFELGGHSLLATRLTARVREVLGVDVAVRTLFEAPTVARLAAVLDGGSAGDALGVLLPLRPGSGRPPLFCVHPGRGLGWSYAGLLPGLPPDLPVYALQARGLVPGEPLARSVDEMAADYLEQVRSIQPHGPYQLLGWSFGGNVAHAMAARLAGQGEEVTLLALLDSYPPVPGYRPTDAEVAAEIAADLDGPDGPIADLGPAQRSAVTAVFANDIRLLADHETPVVPSHLLHVTAAAATHGHQAEEWRPYVMGGIDTHQVDANHRSLLAPGRLATFTRILGPHLRA